LIGPSWVVATVGFVSLLMGSATVGWTRRIWEFVERLTGPGQSSPRWAALSRGSMRTVGAMMILVGLFFLVDWYDG
jgi:hypothetical protein